MSKFNFIKSTPSLLRLILIFSLMIFTANFSFNKGSKLKEIKNSKDFIIGIKLPEQYELITYEIVSSTQTAGMLYAKFPRKEINEKFIRHIKNHMTSNRQEFVNKSSKIYEKYLTLEEMQSIYFNENKSPHFAKYISNLKDIGNDMKAELLPMVRSVGEKSLLQVFTEYSAKM